MSTNNLEKLVWLSGKMVSAGERGISLAELQKAWSEKFDEVYPRRTFNNHREKLIELFGIVVKCHKSTNRYYVPYSEDAFDSKDTSNWMIDTFTVSNLLSLQKERLSGRVSVEEIPSGHNYLTSVMAAMDANHAMKIVYAKYDGSAPDEFHILPYAVKEFSRRWYVVAFCRERNALRVYGLDRIISLEELKETFSISEDFNVDELFHDSFGIYLPEGKKAEAITIRTGQKEARFLRDLPIHRSQTELETLEDGDVLFSLRVIPNENFIMELCKHGSRIEVISPESVRREVAKALRQASELYKDVRLD